MQEVLQSNPFRVIVNNGEAAITLPRTSEVAASLHRVQFLIKCGCFNHLRTVTNGYFAVCFGEGFAFVVHSKLVSVAG